MGAYITTNPTPSGDITGSGTAGYLAIFTSANVIGDSTINQSSGNTGVGMAASANAGFGITTTAASSGIKNGFYFLQTGNTNQTTGTEISGALWNMGTRQWASGAIATQREFYIQSCAYSFTGASVVTDAYGLYAEAPTAGANATITNAYAAGFSGYVNIIADTASIKIRSLVGTTSRWAFYGNQATPSATNYFLNGTNNQTVLNAAQDVLIKVADATKFNIDTVSTVFNQTTTNSGAITAFSWTMGNNTNQTASTEITNYKFNGSNKTWLAGAITNQRWTYFTANTAAFASASTITNSYGLYVEAAVAGTNATITNNYAAGFDGNVYVSGSIGVGTNVNASYVINAAGNINISTGGQLVFSGGDSKIIGIRTGNIYGMQFLGYNGSTIYEFLRVRTSNTSGNTATGAITDFTFTPQTWTNQTASTAISSVYWIMPSRQWATGAITTQKEFELTSPTYSFVGASTITSAYTLYVNAPTAGTNATITNNYAAGFSGNINIIGTPYISGVAGVDGTFTTADAKTVTVTKGLITAIV